MLTRRWDKSRLPSRHVTVGPGRAPHRSYYYAMGLSEEEIDQPFVGVATCWNEAAPCNIALSRQAQSVKKGVNEAGGTPREFTTITVTDGIAMGHQGMKSSLVSRDLIADSVELTMRGHCYDALVGSNPWFRLPQDRWPHAVDVAAVERIASAAARLVVAVTR
jgi:dihydroxy-acid dehydratase